MVSKLTAARACSPHGCCSAAAVAVAIASHFEGSSSISVRIPLARSHMCMLHLKWQRKFCVRQPAKAGMVASNDKLLVSKPCTYLFSKVDTHVQNDLQEGTLSPSSIACIISSLVSSLNLGVVYVSLVSSLDLSGFRKHCIPAINMHLQPCMSQADTCCDSLAGLQESCTPRGKSSVLHQWTPRPLSMMSSQSIDQVGTVCQPFLSCKISTMHGLVIAHLT